VDDEDKVNRGAHLDPGRYSYTFTYFADALFGIDISRNAKKNVLYNKKEIYYHMLLSEACVCVCFSLNNEGNKLLSPRNLWLCE